ncbi:MAG: hypothetical protein LBI94_01820 [Treponema sp.]|jgi:hypothetical protein|nr:hypothetical protein [Treponema sp.]
MKRGGCLILCCCIAAVLLSEFFIVSSLNHDCRGEDCPVCRLIRGAVNFFRRPVPVFSPILALLLLPGILRPFAIVPVSSVRLKVKINS